jgi:hypothetical protein
VKEIKKVQWAIGAISAVAALTYVETAAAEMIIKDTAHHARPPRLDFTGQIDPFGVFQAGFAGWGYIPIVPDGFIPSLNDTFALEFGALLIYNSDEIGVLFVDYDHTWWNAIPMGGVRWDFHLTPLISAFAKAKAGWGIGFGESLTVDGEEVDLDETDVDPISSFAWDFGVGCYFHLSDSFAIRVETGVFSLLAAGVSIAL